MKGPATIGVPRGGAGADVAESGGERVGVAAHSELAAEEAAVVAGEDACGWGRCLYRATASEHS